ncbi:hypothetical protein [Arsenicicoccus dermatophilus]|uniref:hypothetical protein n=1 Tax=Arsenicicoccus dermatophilus TaxID=1076331 RepID=UPI001F4D3408|nr:hypothetical protein [Arsenicicoccus dermatophilus]MCH8611805.1 hypothetical protein [Arsenicicoccus dermatophilus]
MCRPVTCQTCGRTTWAGCGRHVDHVKGSVPADRWCPGHGDAAAPGGQPGDQTGAATGSGFLARLLGR